MSSAAAATDRHELFGVEAVLFVRDVAATVAFYKDVLGFNLDFDYGSPPKHARVSSGESTSPATARIRFELEPTPQSGPRSCSLYVYVARALDDLCGAYKSRGVEIVSPPRDRPWGLRDFQIRDCNGYLLSFVTEVAVAG